ncbi:MAG: transcription elongation factor GreA [Clostridia bacterium]|nr:transcription elongation factor GreA [Clostridia bacterium]
MAEQKTKYTQEGYQKLVDELDYLKTVRRQEVKEMLKEARAFGDLSENSEYDEARDQQAKVESRILELEYLIKNAVIMSEEELNNDTVSIGTTVTIKYTDGKEITYQLVGSNEVDPLNKKISDRSPIGMAVIGHKADETVTIVTPAGEKEALIVSFERTKK